MPTFVRIDTFYDPEEAFIALGYLRSHGIDARLGNRETLANLPELRVALGGYAMLAPDGEADEAAKLLADVRRSPSALGAEQESLRCARCGGGRFRREKSWALPSAITLLFGLPFSWNTGRRRCTNCGALSHFNEDNA